MFSVLLSTCVFNAVISVIIGGDTLVCKSVSDSLVVNPGGQTCDYKIGALEEQVRQLRKLIDAGASTVKHTTIDGIPRDCSEIYSSGIKVDGVYTISPDGRCPFHVYCDMEHGGWTLIQRRQDGTVNFYRTWDEYVQGFGSPEGEHWLGLDKIHRLTVGGSQIYFHLNNYDNSTDYMHYKTFTVHDSTTAYRMNVDEFGYEGTLTELFSYHDNFKFSTYDRDNDASSENCCEKYLNGGGWWSNACYRMGNVNGVYGKKEIGGIGYWNKVHVAYKNGHIKVKPRLGMC